MGDIDRIQPTVRPEASAHGQKLLRLERDQSSPKQQHQQHPESHEDIVELHGPLPLNPPQKAPQVAPTSQQKHLDISA